ncbi:MAG: MlaA family lipoprotein [Betaproteobacteria bacterium]
MFHLVRRLRLTAVCVIVSVGVLGGCASTNDPRDPLEPLNRGVYKFNDAVDTVLLKPVAEIYQGVVPPIARTGIRNVFNNLNDVIVALNNLLQGKFTEAASDVGRIAINTTAGLLGLFDVATPAGLEKHAEDFGQTLGYWGIGDGPYLVLPILGPRNLRDTGGLVVDSLTDPVTYIDPSRDRNQVMGLRLVSRRAELLGASQLLSVAALDEYEFVRDAYIQRRRNLIYDGNPPREKESGINVKPLLALPAEPAKAEDASDTTADTPAEAEINKPEEVSQSDAPAVAAESQSVVRVWLP